MNQEISKRLYDKAGALFPGGVNSPVRAFRAVGGTPRFIVRGAGSRVYDADGGEYIDYVGSWGPLAAGHAHPAVIEAVCRAAQSGTSFGASTPLEIELAELIKAAMPSLEMLRFVNSGTEACMSAIRLARAFTERELIVKFAGCYHGHADALLVDAGSGALTFGNPSSAGVSQTVARQTVVLPYNDTAALERAFNEIGEQVAAVIVEPVAANMGLVLPEPEFLQTITRLTKGHGALLIFDEVITGFRVAFGGAQSVYGIQPDLTCLGKIIGAGLPVGAFGGRADVMRRLAPLGDVYQAGTLSGNPLAMAAGTAQIHLLSEPGTYERLEATTAKLETGLRKAADESDIAVRSGRIGSIFGLFFTHSAVRNLDDAKHSDLKAYASFFHTMLEHGVYLAPSQFEVGFVSLAHSRADIDDTIAAAKDSFLSVRQQYAVS